MSGSFTPSSAMLLKVTRFPADAVISGPVKRNLTLKFGLSFTAAMVVKSASYNWNELVTNANEVADKPAVVHTGAPAFTA
ncbi:hypothetical protein FLLO111716_03470 [Flavobacterium longum]